VSLERHKPLERRTPLRAKTDLRRSAPLERGACLKRRSAPKRSGSISPATPAQREAVHGRACIVCAKGPCDPAHLIDRSLAPAAGDDVLAIVPLCRSCHHEYDEGSLDLLPYLEPRWRDQVAWAVNAVGLMAALKRITNRRSWVPVEDREYPVEAA